MRCGVSLCLLLEAPGLGPPGPWGQGLKTNFVVLKKSPGGRQAKGWETAETAGAEVGAWREAGTGYPPYPHPPAPPPRFSDVREKRKGFSPSPLLKPSNTPPKVGGNRSTRLIRTFHETRISGIAANKSFHCEVSDNGESQ